MSRFRKAIRRPSGAARGTALAGRRNRLFGMAIGIAWLSSLLVPLAAAPAAFAQSPIKVGAIFPLSGGAGTQGQHIQQSLETMSALINEAGGVLGRRIELVVRDDESTPAVGVSRASELVSAGVAVIIEGWNSPVTLAMQPVIARAGVLDLTAISKADPILSGEGNPLAVRFNSSNAQDGAVIARYLANVVKAGKLAFLTQNDAYGTGAQATIEAELAKLGHTYRKVAEERFPFSQADFRVPLTNVRSAAPDATVAINASEGLGMPAIMRQARQMRLPGKLVTAVGTVSPSVIQVSGAAAAEGVIGADIYFPDVEPFASNPVNQRFVAKMQAMHKQPPDKYMALAATALQVWAMAANELETLEREPIAKRIRGGSFKGTVMGDVTFEPNGQLGSRHYLFTVKDGKIVVQP
ncbi:MAG: ABC transporter substrate-binding protein [Burkholderiaceae bacterium]